MGTPAGTNGTASTVARAQTTAIATGSRPFSRGQSRPRNAATAAPSRPHCLGSPRAAPASAPTAVNRFQSTKMPRPGGPEAALLLQRVRLSGARGGGFVNGDVGGGEPPPPARLQQGVDLHAVDAVAHAQQRRRPHRGDAGAAPGHHPDEGELRAAAEQQQAQGHGLPEVESGGDGQGAEGHAIESGGDADGQPDAHRRGLQEFHGRTGFRSTGFVRLQAQAMSGACSGSRRECVRRWRGVPSGP